MMYKRNLTNPASISLFSVNSKNTRKKKSEICSKLAIKKPERRQ